MNEDERGITPPGETSMTLEYRGPGWMLTVERGNGDSVQTIDLTDFERLQLAALIHCEPASRYGTRGVSFMDYSRPPLAASDV